MEAVEATLARAMVELTVMEEATVAPEVEVVAMDPVRVEAMAMATAVAMARATEAVAELWSRRLCM